MFYYLNRSDGRKTINEAQLHHLHPLQALFGLAFSFTRELRIPCQRQRLRACERKYGGMMCGGYFRRRLLYVYTQISTTFILKTLLSE